VSTKIKKNNTTLETVETVIVVNAKEAILQLHDGKTNHIRRHDDDK
jgi:hypothetical protein